MEYILLLFFNNSHFSSSFKNRFGGLRHERQKRRETRQNGDREERELRSCLASSPITRAWVGWGLALSPPFFPQLHRSAVFKFRRCLCLFQHSSQEKSLSQAIREGRRWRQGKRQPATRAGNLRWRRGEEEEPEKTEVEFQIQDERKHKSKEEEDENEKAAVGKELKPVRSIALKNQLYAAVGSLLLTTIFFFSINEVKHKVEEEKDKHGDDVELNLLYIVHSDISSLLHQKVRMPASGGMACEEVGEEVPFILWFSPVFCSLSSSKVRNFKVMALQSDNITINRVESLLKRHQTFY
ncbi:hypothetical protein HID58_075162 [Brassica napus]|uniref:Uncharacterized protein n=1 Tax=Brassica napus TaxID=3708 RepID=A0ABQ7YM18_BRANA|nr:hypothetical protein HID58_075162 [Brassica napus]